MKMLRFLIVFILIVIYNQFADAKEKKANFYCPSTVMPGISNSGEAELKYLVIKKCQKDQQ